MANPAVEKLKDFGIRHGEKVAVGIAGTLCLVFVVLAIIHPTLNLTPGEVEKSTAQAESNIGKKHSVEDVTAKLEGEGMKNPDFVAMVDTAAKNQLDSSQYKVDKLWVTTEPGAGMIRDTPRLIAPTELASWAGRGGALLYALDDKGEKIVDTGTTKTRRERPPGAKKKRRGGMGGSMGGSSSGGGYPGSGGGSGKSSPEKKREQEERDRIAAEKKAALFVGKAEEKEEEKKKEDAAPAGNVDYKEETRGVRWVSLIAVLDYKTLRSRYLEALKDPAVSYPNFKWVELERQSLKDDGTWSEFAPLDLDKNYRVLDNLPQVEEELVSETKRLEDIVDPLPFLKAGFWERIHFTRLVPKSKREAPKAEPGGMMGGGMGGRSMSMGGGMMGGSSMGDRSGGMSMGGGMMGGSSMGMGMGGGAVGGDDMTFTKTEEDEVMIRALDFTVAPDTTYKYRMRIIVFNPNEKRQDVSPGTDVTSKELAGPWSELSEEVTVPADVVTFAIAKPKSGRRPDQVDYKVVRFNPDDGRTVVSTFTASPGEIIGEYKTTAVAEFDGKGRVSKPVDFTSHQVVLDAIGGPSQLPTLPGVQGFFDVPALSTVIRSDGTLVVRNQARDLLDPEFIDMDETYSRELKDADKKRAPGMGYGSFGGSSSMGGGYPGMGGGGGRTGGAR